MNVARCYWIFRQNSFELVVLSCANQRKANFFRNMLCHVIADMPIMQFVIEGDFIHFFFLVHTDTLNIFSASSHCIMQNSCHTKYVFLLLFYFSLILQTNIQSFIESNIFFLICKANVHMTTFIFIIITVCLCRPFYLYLQKYPLKWLSNEFSSLNKRI